MNPENYLGQNILKIFLKEKDNFNVFTFSKIEHISFLEYKEDGFFLTARDDNIIDFCTIYLQPYHDFFPFHYQHKYKNIMLNQIIEKFGSPVRKIPSIQIDKTKQPTLIGLEYIIENKKYIYHFDEDEKLIYFSVSLFQKT